MLRIGTAAEGGGGWGEWRGEGRKKSRGWWKQWTEKGGEIWERWLWLENNLTATGTRSWSSSATSRRLG
ncbi:unnamed protein product [Linum trigynum]|uniref:Uncharacterized protein n=1 Tax=Linum trigynum TaxID=586398 RepID=A0AAV2D022_9ROSI